MSRDKIIVLSIMVEKYLTEIAINGGTYSLVIDLEDLDNLEKTDLSIIPKERVTWIKNHVGFESFRYSLN